MQLSPTMMRFELEKQGVGLGAALAVAKSQLGKVPGVVGGVVGRLRGAPAGVAVSPHHVVPAGASASKSMSQAAGVARAPTAGNPYPSMSQFQQVGQAGTQAAGVAQPSAVRRAATGIDNVLTSGSDYMGPVAGADFLFGTELGLPAMGLAGAGWLARRAPVAKALGHIPGYTQATTYAGNQLAKLRATPGYADYHNMMKVPARFAAGSGLTSAFTGYDPARPHQMAANLEAQMLPRLATQAGFSSADEMLDSMRAAREAGQQWTGLRDGAYRLASPILGAFGVMPPTVNGLGGSQMRRFTDLVRQQVGGYDQLAAAEQQALLRNAYRSLR